jgi:hypothetical protein
MRTGFCHPTRPQGYPQRTAEARPHGRRREPRSRTAWDRCASRSAAEEPDQLLALAIGQPGERLCRRDSTAGERARCLGRADLGQREQEVVDLRRPCERGRLGDDVFDPHPARGELPLQPCPPDPDLVRVPQRAPALIERPRGSGLARLCRHGRILGDLSLTGRPSRASPRTTPARVFPSPSPENDRACLQERVCAPHRS